MDSNSRNDNNVQKLKTGISGLDNLFYSGIQLSQYAEIDKVDIKKDKETGQKDASQGNDDENIQENNGIVIAIRGVKGTHKLLLATQMLQGLTREVNSLFLKRKREPGHLSLLYSLNKSRNNLHDLYLDLLLSCFPRKSTISSRKTSIKKTAYGIQTYCLLLYSNRKPRIKTEITAKTGIMSPMTIENIQTCIS